MMLSICTLPISPAKNSSSVTAALISLRAGRRSNSLDNLISTTGKQGTQNIKLIDVGSTTTVSS